MYSITPKRYVGIDVSKDRLDVCLLPREEAFAVANDQECLLGGSVSQRCVHPAFRWFFVSPSRFKLSNSQSHSRRLKELPKKHMNSSLGFCL